MQILVNIRLDNDQCKLQCIDYNEMNEQLTKYGILELELA